MKKLRDEKILALSWKQPYAELMLHGKIETRTWKTDYRGSVLICASKKLYNEQEIISISGVNQYERIKNILIPYLIQNARDYTGYAIAIGNLVDCRPMTKADEDKCFVEYRKSWTVDVKNKKTGKIKIVQKKLWCHVYENVQRIEPFLWKGTQGWKTVEPNIIDTIEIK